MGPLVIKRDLKRPELTAVGTREAWNDKGHGREAQITSAEHALESPRAYTHTHAHTVCIYTCVNK